MFIDKQTEDAKKYYKEMLQIFGALSRLFSENTSPFIDPRVAENLFCKAFTADNKSRQDTSADAVKTNLGIGIKTFLDGINGSSYQKVAEFNRERMLFASMKPKDLIRKVSELRNIRLETTISALKLEDLIYHCIIRRQNEILICEYPMHSVVVEDITSVKDKGNVISFNDGLNEYSFNISKSTLSKKFSSKINILSAEVNLLEDPFELLENLITQTSELSVLPVAKEDEYVILPLYSTKNDVEYVPEKSGLNAWNGGGRSRDVGEVYIPVPAWIHKNFPKFFPTKDTSFNLLLPNRDKLKAKLCQENSKALMSDPNKALGEWVLRDVLHWKEGEVITYDDLQAIGLDSVRVTKKSSGDFEIDLIKTGGYKDFVSSTRNKD